MKKRTWGVVALLAFIGTIFAANWTLEHYGVRNIGGLMVPAGVVWVGLAFTLRDFAHEGLGRVAIVLGIIAGALLSWLVAPSFAAASGLAFLFSESADFAVYEPLRKRHWLGAVALSGLVGTIVDSIIFLQIAFHSLEFLPGQVIGKGVVLAATVALLAMARGRKVAAAPA